MILLNKTISWVSGLNLFYSITNFYIEVEMIIQMAWYVCQFKNEGKVIKRYSTYSRDEQEMLEVTFKTQGHCMCVPFINN